MSTQPFPAEKPPHDSLVDSPDGLDALAGLVEGCDLEFDPYPGREALRLAIQDSRLGPLDRLARAAGEFGLRLMPARWTTREALGQLHDGVPLVTAAAGEPGGYLVLVRRDGGRAELHTGERVGERELNARLGGQPDEAREWALARPVAACGGLGADGGAHGAHGADHGGHGAAGHAGPTPLRRLVGLLRPEMRDLQSVAIFAVGVGVLSLALPITVEALVSTVQGGNEAMLQVVIVLSGVLCFCLTLAGAMRAYQTYLVELIQRRIFLRVADDLAFRLPRVQIKAFDQAHGPELVNRFFDVLTVQKTSATLLLDGLAVLLQAVVGLAVLAVWHPYLLALNGAILASLLVLIFLLGRGAVPANIRESYAKYSVAGWLEEMVRHPLAFKSTAERAYALARADEGAREYLNARELSFRILYRQILFGIVLQVAASTALLGLGGWLVIRNELTTGQLVAAELIVAVMVGSFVKLGKSLESYYDLMAAVDKLGHLIDLPLERDQGEYPPPVAGPAAVELKKVSFAYPEGDAHGEAVHGITASIRPGERVALVGPSGSGKSTLLELLYALRQPTSGVIELDGIDLRDLRQGDLREQVSAVAYDEVFAGTVLDNVRIGHPIPLSQVREALRAVRLLDTVQAMPQGLYTPLATGGAPLSRGQAQRLCLARALACRPRLLLIDGVLDQLDPEVRQSLLPALFDRQAPWTLLIISHDPDVLAACDRRLELPAPTAVFPEHPA